MSDMTIAEALNELKRINDLVQTRINNIRRYCSKMKGTDDEIVDQRVYVTRQHQSAKDLIKRYIAIKKLINQSNLDRFITFKGKEMSVAEAILFKQWTHETTTKLLASFEDANAQGQIMQVTQMRMSGENLEKLNIIPQLLYDEKEILTAKEQNLNLYSFIDALIEKSNHHTFIPLEQLPEE